MQANKYKIPRLGFINKLDRLGSNIDITISSIKNRLKCQPLLVNIQSEDSNEFRGLIDLPSMLLFEYVDESGKYVDIKQLSIKS